MSICMIEIQLGFLLLLTFKYIWLFPFLFLHRCSGVEHFILKNIHKLPNMEFILNPRDWPQSPKPISPKPVFSFSKVKSKHYQFPFLFPPPFRPIYFPIWQESSMFDLSHICLYLIFKGSTVLQHGADIWQTVPQCWQIKCSVSTVNFMFCTSYITGENSALGYHVSSLDILGRRTSSMAHFPNWAWKMGPV